MRLSPLGIPYWMRPETRSAAAIYAIMAVVTLSLFASIWRSLRRFGRLAQRRSNGASFHRIVLTV